MPRTHATARAEATQTTRDTSALRARIIEEHYLREEIARDEALRRDRPDVWHHCEARRIARNRSQTELNHRLRAAGCRPVRMELSLKQKMKKLQRLEAQNLAETATATEPA